MPAGIPLREILKRAWVIEVILLQTLDSIREWSRTALLPDCLRRLCLPYYSDLALELKYLKKLEYFLICVCRGFCVIFFLFSLDEKKVSVSIFCFICLGSNRQCEYCIFVFSFCFLFLPVLLLSLPFSLDLYIMRDSPKLSDDLKKKENCLVNRKLLKKQLPAILLFLLWEEEMPEFNYLPVLFFLISRSIHC